MSDEPAIPRPAATVILLRRGPKHGDRGLEVLFARRTEEARFMPGVWVFPGGAVDAAELDAHSEDDAYRICGARELEEEVGVQVAPSELHQWIRWITPEEVPVRFDTRFYVALAPPHASPAPDTEEITEVAWMSPHRALERNSAGEIELVFPTVRTLETLLPFATSEAALAAAAERDGEPILPKVIGTREDWRVVLPGDPDYPAG
ncbi:MAG: NUDIX hydrolase [Solirubrobacterales bacterium]